MGKRRLKLSLACVVVSLVLSGCLKKGKRVIIVPASDPIQLRNDIEEADVWVFDKDGGRVPAKVRLYSGQYVISDTDDEIDE